MAKDTNTDTGKPSGVNKPEPRTGVPSQVSDDNRANDERMTEQYTNDDGGISDGIRTMHPNRNEDKDDATNIGGYRS